MNHLDMLSERADARATSSPIAESRWTGLHRRVRKAIGTLTAAVVLLLVALPLQATALLGPADPQNPPVIPLGPVSFTPAGTYGVSPGATWTFSTVTLATKTTVYHAALPNAVKLSFNGAFAAPGETLTYNAAGSNPAAGIVQYIGSTTFFATTSNTRVTLTYTTNGTTPIALITAASIGAPASIGLLAPVPSTGFVVNYYAEAQNATYGFSAFTAAKTVYDTINQNNFGSGGTLAFDFTAGFYWNDVPPTLNVNTGLTINQGATATITPGMLLATDVESGPAQVTFTLPTSGGGPPHAGTLFKSAVPLAAGQTFTQADINNSLITYNTGFPNGCQISDSFQFSVSDADGAVIPPPPGPPTVFSFPITISLIHLAPIANNDSFSVGLGAQHTGNLTANNANQCWAPIFTYSLGVLPTKGTVVLNDPSTGAYTYSATPGQTGPDSFTFTVINNADPTKPSNPPGVVSINIAIQPPVAQDQTVSTTEGTPVNGTLVATDVDQPPQTLTYSIVTNGTKGTAAIFNATTGTFAYTPSPGRSGTDTFTFKANDGTLDSNVATVTVNIRGALKAGRIVTSAGAVSGKNKDVVLVDPVTGDQSVLASIPGSGVELRGVAIEGTGKILALENGSGTLARIDPVTGTFAPVGSPIPGGFSLGVAVESSGQILVTTGPGGSILRVDPVTGAQTTFATGSPLKAPLAITVASNGDIYVADAGQLLGGSNNIIKIDPVSAAQTVISTAQFLIAPVGIARNSAGMLFVTDAPQALGQPSGPSQVIQVDPTGAANLNQTLVVNSGLISAPAGIGVASDGSLLTANVVGGSIVRIDLTGPTQSTVSSGGDLAGAFGLAIFAAPPNFTGAASRKVHGTAGTFNLPLAP